jgi:hypothetical protein
MRVFLFLSNKIRNTCKALRRDQYTANTLIYSIFLPVFTLIWLTTNSDGWFFTIVLKSDNGIWLLTSPILTYSNPHTLKLTILIDNLDKTGIKTWSHISSGKSYVACAINLHNKNCSNICYLALAPT